MKIKITDIILWILFILSIVVGLWYIFGSSPTFEQSLLIFLISAIFGITISLTNVRTKLNYIEKRANRFEEDIKNSFNKIKEDMDLIKKDTYLIKNKLKVR